MVASMSENMPQFQAIISTDWSECLSPNGPFDPITFNYPELEPDLGRIFREYTSNTISLTQATSLIEKLLPEPLTQEQMDAYLDASFKTYMGVPKLIEWCADRGILFMINTTGTQGYFQRAIAKSLLAPVPTISANPMIRFPQATDGLRYVHEIQEIADKPRSTEAVMGALNIPPGKVLLMGDSGGDGPHFEWGASRGMFLVGSMTKHSLATYCRSRGIAISRRFGLIYGPEERRDLEREMKVDFMELARLIEDALDL
jgi:2-hydroxy-3-keto-5-methylthiopentenyl-1-phosphate phosphatase